MPAGLHDTVSIEIIFFAADLLASLQGTLLFGDVVSAAPQLPPAQRLQAVVLEEELAAVHGIPLIVDINAFGRKIVAAGRDGNGLLFAGRRIFIRDLYGLSDLMPSLIGAVL